METRESLGKFINSVNEVLVEDRLKLNQNVFIERHLPTIINNNNLPTKDLQAELIKIAGSDIKVIDLIDDSGNVVISLPPAIGSSKVISNTSGKLSGLGRKFSDIAATVIQGNDEGAQQLLKKVLVENKQEIIENLSENPWDKVVEHFSDKNIKVKPVKKQTTEAITFDYD